MLSVLREAHVFEIGALIGFEINVDGIHRYNRRQESGFGGSTVNEIAFGDKLPADASGDGRGNPGEFNVELRRFDSGARGFDRLDGLPLGSCARVGFLL